MDFLILKPSSLGDILHAFPAVNALLRENPGSSADWLIHPAFAELTAYLPGVRQNIIFDRKKLGGISTFASAFSPLYHQLRERKYDAVIDLQGLARSAFLGRLAAGGIHAGPANPREKIAKLCYDKYLHAPPEVHAVLRNNAMIADFLGRPETDFTFHMPVIEKYESEAERLFQECGLSKDRPVCAIAPGARWETKQWPPEFFADLILALHRLQGEMQFLILGTKGELPLSQIIQERAAEAEPVCLCGKTSPGVLVEVIRKTSLFLCNDSGPMHIAAALNIPVLVMFGPTEPGLTGPYTERSCILQPPLSCISCFRRHCRDCLCHRQILPGEAARRAEILFLNSKKSTAKG